MTSSKAIATLLIAALSALAAATALPGAARAFTPEQAKAPMTVTLVRSDAMECGADCPEWLAMTGKIGFDTVGRLKTALARLGSRRVPVFVDSPGGEGKAGLALGEMIRAHCLDVVVAGTTLSDCAPTDSACRDRLRAGLHPGSVTFGVAACAYACVFVLAGGSDRSVPAGSYVGVHQAKQIQTFHPVLNTFRVLKRIVAGHAVEISRTLVGSRALPGKTVVSAAPETLYSEFDRYLLRMGIDESIMRLMRATPPSGIHWMTDGELASTRIATSSTSASVLLGREAAAVIAASPSSAAPVVAALTLDDGRRWFGTATWRLDVSAAKAPKLVVDVAIPEKHLTGTMTFVKSTASGDVAAFTSAIRWRSDADAGPPITDMGTPQFCGRANCSSPLAIDPGFDGRRFGSFSFAVAPDREGDLRFGLRDDLWLDLPVQTAEGWGKVTISLTNAGSVPIATWENLCCAMAIPDWLPRATPTPALPAPPTPALARVRDTAQAAPAQVATTAPPHADAATIRDGASLTMTAPLNASNIVRYDGSANWTLLATPAKLGPPGFTTLIATAEVPAAGIRVTLGAGIGDRPDGRGDVALDIRVETNDSRIIGPLASMTQLPVPLPGGGLGLHTDSVTPISAGDYEFLVQVPAKGAVGPEIRILLMDEAGRSGTLSLPMSEAVRDLIRADAQASAALAD